MSGHTTHHAAMVQGLPTPIAMPWARLDATDDKLTQMTAMLATLEAIHRLLAAFVLAEHAGPAVSQKLRTLLERGTLGALREVLDATRAGGSDADRPLTRRIWRWLEDPAAKLALQRTKALRNDYAHGRMEPADSRLASMMANLADDLSLLLRSLAWLEALDVVTVERGDLGLDESCEGRVRLFRGPVVPSPLRPLRWRGALPVGHAYALDRGRGAALLLSPWAAAIDTSAPGLCTLGLIDRWTSDGMILSTPLQPEPCPSLRRTDVIAGGWRAIELLEAWAPATTPTASRRPASAPPAASVAPRPAPGPTSAPFGRVCPDCNAPRRVLRAPFESGQRRFLRCDGCRTVVMIEPPSAGGLAAPTTTLLWSRETEAVAVLPDRGPALLAVAGPLEGRQIAIPALPTRLGVLGSTEQPRAAVLLARTVRGELLAFAAFGEMRLARDGVEADLLQLAAGDEIEVGRSRYRVLAVGIGP